MGAWRSAKAERVHLSESMRAQGKTWAQIAEDFQLRYAVNARVAFRLARGLSQGDVAREWTQRWPDEPKTAQNISTWERWPIGGHEPSLTTLGLLAEIYECDLAHLVADLGRHQHLDQAVNPSSLVAVRPRQLVPRPQPQHLERDHLRLEADLFDPMDLAGMATASDIGAGTIDVVQEAVELLCCAYAVTPARLLRDRSQQRLSWILELLGKRISLSQHSELLVGAAWLAALLGCVHYDLGEREQAEAARQAAEQFATEARYGEVLGWAQEMSAWFALVEGRYEQAIAASEAGLAVAGSTSAGVQLALQAAKAYARIGDRAQAADALNRGAAVLDRLPRPGHSEHHFIFDHAKWSLYAAGVSVLIEDDRSAEEHAREVLARHLRPDGSSNSPMRVADARIDLAIVHTRQGDLDAAVEEGLRAFEPERRSLADLLARGGDLMSAIQLRHPGDPRANALDERLREARKTLQSPDRGYLNEGAGKPGQAR